MHPRADATERPADISPNRTCWPAWVTPRSADFVGLARAQGDHVQKLGVWTRTAWYFASASIELLPQSIEASEANWLHVSMSA